MDTDYVESVWWSLKQIFDQGLLVQDHRVAPYCPRCGTGLSDHELAQGYETVVDPSVYVRFPVTGGALAERHPGLALLIWTTTPWTLVSQHRGGGQPGRLLRRRAHRQRRAAGRRRGAARGGARRGLRRARDAARQRGRGDARTRAPSPAWSSRRPTARCTPCSPPTSSPPRTAPASCTRRRRSAPEDLALCRSYGLPVVQPAAPRRHVRAGGAARRRRVLQEGRRRARRRPRAAQACCSSTCRTSTPTRTAGAATRRSSTTRSRPGTSAPPR